MLSAKKIALAALPLVFAAANAMAIEVNEYTLNDIKAMMEENPAAIAQVSEPVDVKADPLSFKITDENSYLMPVTAASKIISYSKTKAQFEEFSAKWKPVLLQNGLKPAKTFYDEENGFGYIEYESPEGYAIRDFIADRMDYDALKPAAINAVKNQVKTALSKANLQTVAVLDLNMSIFRPTFRQYYLTKFNENADKEIRIRQLDLGADDDLDVVKNRLNIIRIDRNSQVFHIGPRMNCKWKIGKDEKDMAERIAAYKEYLKENGFEFVGYKVHDLETPADFGGEKYTLLANIYFFL